MNDSLFDRANDVNEQTAKQNSHLWGKIRMEVWEAALVKGVGKVPFDPLVHKRSSVAIDLYIDPMPGVDSNFTPERHMAEFERDWYAVTKPSALEALTAAGIEPHIKHLPNLWAKVIFAPTGETYTNAQNEVKEKTAIKFVQIFDSEEKCRSDYLTSYNQPATGGTGGTVTLEQNVSGVNAQTVPYGNATQTVPNEAGQDKKKFLPFLKVIVQNAAMGEKDLDAVRNKIATQLANYPQLKSMFTVDSPETMEYLMAVTAAA